MRIIKKLYNKDKFFSYNNFYSITKLSTKLSKYIVVFGHFINNDYQNLFYCYRVINNNTLSQNTLLLKDYDLLTPNNNFKYYEFHNIDDALKQCEKLNLLN